MNLAHIKKPHWHKGNVWHLTSCFYGDLSGHINKVNFSSIFQYVFSNQPLIYNSTLVCKGEAVLVDGCLLLSACWDENRDLVYLVSLVISASKSARGVTVSILKAS